MKKIEYFLVTIIALGAIMTSCEKETQLQVGIDNNKVTITVQKEKVISTETKTSINGKVVTWIEGDKLSLYAAKAMGDNSVVGEEFEISGGQNSMSATFEGSLEPQSESVYAVYPHNTDARFTNTTYTSNFVMEQTQEHDVNSLKPTSIGQYAYMYGRSEGDVTSTTGITILMKHLTTILDFKLTDIPPGTKVNSLILKSDILIIPNKVEVDLTNGTSSFSSKVDMIKVNLKTDGVEGVTVSENLTIRLAMLPTTVPAGGKLIISLQTVQNGVTRTDNITKLFNLGQVFEAGKVYPTVLALDEIEYLMYPKLEIPASGDVASYSIYVCDRNAGTSVPDFETVPAGEAKSWINGIAESDNNVKLFQGDHYYFADVENDNSMCPAGWRVPNASEMDEVISNITAYDNNEIILTGTNGAKCYFTMSGYLPGGSSDLLLNYWTNEIRSATDYSYYFIFEGADSGEVPRSVFGSRDWAYSVRCVKTATK